MHPNDLMKPDLLSELVLAGGVLAFAAVLLVIVIVALHSSPL